MPLTHVTDCPHCMGEKMGMTLVAACAPESVNPTAIFHCNGCHNIVCVKLLAGYGTTQWITGGVGTLVDAAPRHGAYIQDSYPMRKRVEIPEHIPDVARRAYIQGFDNHQRGHSDAAASMYRKAIDVATKTLDATLAAKNLAPRIDALHAAGKLTDDLKDWAHLIRLDGNQGVHDDVELTNVEISQLASFTELFLTYTFTLPAQVAARKAAAEAADG